MITNIVLIGIVVLSVSYLVYKVYKELKGLRKQNRLLQNRINRLYGELRIYKNADIPKK